MALTLPCLKISGLNLKQKGSIARNRSYCSVRFLKSGTIDPFLISDPNRRSLTFVTMTNSRNKASASILPPQVLASASLGRGRRWWNKTTAPNMLEIQSAQHLVESLSNAGDKLVIIDFYSPGCGGCRALHPKICQFAEYNPDAIFLKVNYEELKNMCYSLHIHVLPFFRFYRGAEGRLCSFSCTNATIKKFRDALEKHGTDRCVLGRTKGMDESDLMKLASAGEISFDPLLIRKLEGSVEDTKADEGHAMAVA